MLKNIKLVISERGRDIDTIIRETNTDPPLLYKSLEEFRQITNDALTKLIEDSDDMAEYIEEDISTESEHDDDVCSNPKRKKKKSLN